MMLLHRLNIINVMNIFVCLCVCFVYIMLSTSKIHGWPDYKGEDVCNVCWFGLNKYVWASTSAIDRHYNGNNTEHALGCACLWEFLCVYTSKIFTRPVALYTVLCFCFK